MSEETEEKRLPASDKKLRDARQKGQTWHSHDLVSAVALLFALAYLNMAWPDIAARVDRLLDVVIEATTQPFEAGIGRVSEEFGWAVLLTLLPLAIVVVVATVLSAAIIMGGPVLSTEPIKPKFENINPVKGLQRIVLLSVKVALGSTHSRCGACWSHPATLDKVTLAFGHALEIVGVRAARRQMRSERRRNRLRRACQRRVGIGRFTKAGFGNEN